MMVNVETKALKAERKRPLTVTAEQTRPGPAFTPVVDIFETEGDIMLLADMPGVKAEDLTIDLRENVLTMKGEVDPPEGAKEADVFREYRTGKYFREFTLSGVIDQTKIEAELKEGVLRLKLPKVEAATPRKIAVKTQ
jgi:HSP20 family molecular chaperone IbpA